MLKKFKITEFKILRMAEAYTLARLINRPIKHNFIYFNMAYDKHKKKIPAAVGTITPNAKILKKFKRLREETKICLVSIHQS